MSLDDFCRCYCEEFEAICRAWSDMRENENRDSWERTRILASITISPYVKKPLSPQKLMPMPWDKRLSAGPVPPPEQENLTMAERRTRASEAFRKFG